MNIKEIRSKLLSVIRETLKKSNHFIEIGQEDTSGEISSSEKSSIEMIPNSSSKILFAVKINVLIN